MRESPAVLPCGVSSLDCSSFPAHRPALPGAKPVMPRSPRLRIVLALSALDNEIKPVVVQRLKMAGVRLAWLLNEAFK